MTPKGAALRFIPKRADEAEGNNDRRRRRRRRARVPSPCPSVVDDAFPLLLLVFAAFVLEVFGEGSWTIFGRVVVFSPMKFFIIHQLLQRKEKHLSDFWRFRHLNYN